mmetsp:Transcript_19750/g.40113  ORF Transcript_19750/g.40113 Transcript_19750/m.40113 type:complete len:329 (+) Transcript_19750:178-1164(+)
MSLVMFGRACSRFLLAVVLLLVLTAISNSDQDVADDEYKPICAEENERPSLGMYLSNNGDEDVAYSVLLLHTDQCCHEIITDLSSSSPSAKETGASPVDIIYHAWTSSQRYAAIVNATHRISTTVTIATDSSIPWPERGEYRRSIIDAFNVYNEIDILAIADCYFVRPIRTSFQEDIVLLPNSLCHVDGGVLEEVRQLESNAVLDQYVKLVSEFMESLELDEPIPVTIVGHGQFASRIIEGLSLEMDNSIRTIDFTDIVYNAAVYSLTERNKGCYMWDEWVSICNKVHSFGGGLCYSCDREEDIEWKRINEEIKAYTSKQEQLCPKES